MLDAGDGVHRFLTTDLGEAERSAVCVYRAGSAGLVSNLRPVPPRPPPDRVECHLYGVCV